MASYICYAHIDFDHHRQTVEVDIERGESPLHKLASECARICAANDDAGLEVWFTWAILGYDTDTGNAKWMTRDAIQWLVHERRRAEKWEPVPAWWAEHDPSLTPEELDTYEPEESEDWSPLTLQRELGTY